MTRLAGLLLLLAATPALAYVGLRASDPLPGAHVKSPGLIRLTFSGALEPARSGAALIDAAGRTVPVSAAVGAGTITLMPLTLRPGRYTVQWHGIGDDGRKAGGHFDFTVVP